MKLNSKEDAITNTNFWSQIKYLTICGPKLILLFTALGLNLQRSLKKPGNPVNSIAEQLSVLKYDFLIE